MIRVTMGRDVSFFVDDDEGIGFRDEGTNPPTEINLGEATKENFEVSIALMERLKIHLKY